jgi:hypothetical protein
MRATTHSGIAGLIALTGALALCSPCVAAQSTAVGVEGNFQANGLATRLGPVAAVAGQASGKYDLTRKVATASDTTILAPQLLRPTAFVSAANLTSHVSASGFGIDSRSSHADATVGEEAVRLFTAPPPGSGLPDVLYLTVTTREAIASANFSQTVPMANFANGSAQVGSLSVSGRLLGAATISYSGQAPANTVVYDSPTVTITVNRQLTSGVVSCSQRCTFSPSKIDVAAVDVELHEAAIGGTKVSGHILISDTIAE